MFKEDGIREGIKIGREEGREEVVFDVLFSLVKKKLLSVKDAANQAGISEEAFRQKMAAK